MANLPTELDASPPSGTTATAFRLTVAYDAGVSGMSQAETDAKGDPGAETDEPPPDALRLAAVSAALLVAAAGIWFTVWAGRRRRAAAEAEALALADETKAILDRRALRRARVLMPEDPIVGSLGIEEPDAAARRPRGRRPRRQTGGSGRP